MADLGGVIRLKRFHLDEKRRVLGDLNALLAELFAERDRLDAQVLVEPAHAEASLEGQMAYGKFAQAAIARRRRLGESIGQVEGQIESATDQVLDDAFIYKKFMITQADREQRT